MKRHVLYACARLHACVTVTVNGLQLMFVQIHLFFYLCSFLINNHHLSCTRRGKGGQFSLFLDLPILLSYHLIYKHQVWYTVCVSCYTLTNILTLSSCSCRTTTNVGVRQRLEGKRVRQRERGKIDGVRELDNDKHFTVRSDLPPPTHPDEIIPSPNCNQSSEKHLKSRSPFSH